MRILFSILMASVFLLPLSTRPANAQTGAHLFELYTLSQTDPATAAVTLDQTLAEMQTAGIPDLRTYFDVATLRAEVAVRLGDWDDAALIYGQLSQAAEANPDLDEDPVQLMAQAAEAARQSGDLRAARAAVRQQLNLLAERTPSSEVLAEMFDTLADLSEELGDTVAAARNRTAAAQARVTPTQNDVPSRTDDLGYRTVKVYYATDRARSGDAQPAAFYSGKRGDALEMGVATVTVPNEHTPGMLETPSIWKLQFSANPGKHVVLQSVTPMDAARYFGQLQNEFVDDAKTEAFVFVHGYNVAFDQAARRAAQISVDIGYPAVPILYSWPSHGKTLAYVADTAAVRLSGRRLSRFLDELVETSGAKTIHVIAHSMGNRALTDALELLALKRQVSEGDTPLLGQVVFAAPDVDAGLFREMVNTIRPLAKRLTLYASEQDWALVSSRKLHGNAPRAGQGGDDTLSSPDFDSVDMSELGEDMLAHNYFADDKAALADIVTLFWRNVDPARRCGLELKTNPDLLGSTWQYRQDRCAARTLISAMAHLREAKVETVPQAMTALNLASDSAAVRSQIEEVITQLLQD